MRVVDEALDRLSDAFALQARDDAIAEHGEEAWIAQLTERADLLKERLERPAGDRFAPAAQGEPAYDRADVDALCDQLVRSEEHTSELQSRGHLVCRLLLEKKNNT